MALKHGRDKLACSASSLRAGKRALIKTITDCLRSQAEQEEGKPILLAGISKRQAPHFHCERIDLFNSLKLLGQKGPEQPPSRKAGVIKHQALEGTHDMLKRTTINHSLTCGTRQGCQMASTFDAGPSAEGAG